MVEPRWSCLPPAVCLPRSASHQLRRHARCLSAACGPLLAALRRTSRRRVRCRPFRGSPSPRRSINLWATISCRSQRKIPGVRASDHWEALRFLCLPSVWVAHRSQGYASSSPLRSTNKLPLWVLANIFLVAGLGWCRAARGDRVVASERSPYRYLAGGKKLILRA